MRYWVLCFFLSGCSMIEDDRAGEYSNRPTKDCLSQVTPYQHEASSELPGNASSLAVRHCQIIYNPFPTIHMIADVRLRQNICKWGTCVTAWSYSTTVTGEAFLDASCNMQSARIRINPEVALLRPLANRLEMEGPANWPKLLEKHPEIKRIACE